MFVIMEGGGGGIKAGRTSDGTLLLQVSHTNLLYPPPFFAPLTLSLMCAELQSLADSGLSEPQRRRGGGTCL